MPLDKLIPGNYSYRMESNEGGEMTTAETTWIELEAVEPTELAPPTSGLRWYVTGEYTAQFPIVRIEGTRDAIEQFVRLHWGDEMFEMPDGVQSFSPDEFFDAYGPKH